VQADTKAPNSAVARYLYLQRGAHSHLPRVVHHRLSQKIVVRASDEEVKIPNLKKYLSKSVLSHFIVFCLTQFADGT
jgi:hypothetical protein